VTSADTRGASRSSLAWDVVLLAALLALALLLSHRGSGFSVDEGSYAIQAHALRDGGWAIHWPFRALDPAGAHFPYHGGTVTPIAEYAYVSHPAWPAALSVLSRVVPATVGLRLLSMVSVIGAALCSAGIARRLFGDGSARWAFWLTATSPLLADGLMVWAHAPAAAVAGLAVLAGLALTRGEDRRWWPVLVVAVAAGVLLRSEAVLLALALGGVVGLAGLVGRHGRAVAVGLVTGATTAASFALERSWIHHVTGTSGLGALAREGSDTYSWLSGRVHGAEVALVQGATSSGAGAITGLLAVALVAAAVVARRRPDLLRTPPWILLAASAVLVVLRTLVADADPVSGLLAAWPAALLALLSLGRTRSAPLLLAVGSALFAIAVVLTQYDDGGGLQWGGRYLAPMLVPIAALAAGGVVAGLASVQERRAVAGLLAATALLALVVPDHVRRGNAEGLGQVRAVGERVVLVHGDQLARLDWTGWPDRCWIADDHDVQGTVRLLAGAAVRAAAYVDFAVEDFAGTGAVVTPERPGARVGTVDLSLAIPGPAARPQSVCR
jgi:hypothetical protein